jgi:hypothetical protein
MRNQDYLNQCENHLREFEIIQLKMLRLELADAGNDFLAHIKQMRQFFEQTSNELLNYSFNMHRDKILLVKQIERLLVFLKEMDLHIIGFQSMLTPDENEIIFIFERQHIFKNIYRKHMGDFESIIK